MRNHSGNGCPQRESNPCEKQETPLDSETSPGKFCRHSVGRIDGRFWSRVDIRSEDECWLWRGWLDQHGYGRWGYSKRKKEYAHRFAWRLTWCEIPEGLVVMHSCDVPACCNPAHLMLGTQRANLTDRDRKGRGVVPVRANGRWTGQHRRVDR